MEFICMIVNTTAGWWELLGDNSGQIQIIIAVLAFGLAFFVFKKVLKQIELAIEQNKHAALQANQAIEQTKQMVAQTKNSNERSQTAINQQKLIAEQNKFLLQQRASEMKFNIINLIDKNVDSNNKMLIHFPQLLKEFKEASKRLQDKNDDRYKIIDTHISSFERQKNMINNTKNKLIQLSKDISSQDVMDIDFLEKHINVLSETLVSSTDSKYNYIIILANLEDVKQETGLI